jgi:hypothetical protein
MPGAWRLPSITAELKGDALRALPVAVEGAKSASQSRMKKWLTSLGTQTAHRKDQSGHTVESRIELMAATMEVTGFASGAFTQRSLAAASCHFAWFPSMAELAEFLKPLSDEAKEQPERVRKIADAPIDRFQPNRMAGARDRDATCDPAEIDLTITQTEAVGGAHAVNMARFLKNISTLSDNQRSRLDAIISKHDF